MELRRRILVELQSYKRALEKVQSGTFSHEECAPLKGSVTRIDELPSWHSKQSNAYQRRFSELDEKEDNLIALFDEASALWGDDVVTWLKEVTVFGDKLAFYIGHKMRSENPKLKPKQRQESGV